MDLTKDKVFNKLAKSVDGKKESVALGQTQNFVDVFRRLYNDMCVDCKVKALRCIKRGASFKYELMCDDCKLMAKGYELEANSVLEG